jgi:hypothetical protein
MIHGMPGIGGSLGCCAVCGKSFIAEIIGDAKVRVIEVDGIDGDLCVHDDCMPALEGARDRWEELPEGPLRAAYERATATRDAGAGI